MILTNRKRISFLEKIPGIALVNNGKWDKNTTYVGTPTLRPRVYHNGEWYSLGVNGSILGVDPAQSVALQDGRWLLLDNFQTLITKSIVIEDFADVAGFIFYEGFFFSQHGTDLDGNPSTDWENYPLGTFIPNFIVNAVTGDFAANKGTFSGDLKGVSGTFTELKSVDKNGNVGGRIYFYNDGFGFDGRSSFYDRILSYDSIILSGKHSTLTGGAVYAPQGFGHSTLTTLVISGMNAQFYPRGLGYRAFREDFVLEKIDSTVYIPVSQTLKNEVVFPNQPPQARIGYIPIDLVIFTGTPAGDYALQTAVEGKTINVVNCSNSRHYIVDFRQRRSVDTTEMFYCIYVGSLVSSTSQKGKGWLMSYLNK